jgi:hypothetical protein
MPKGSRFELGASEAIIFFELQGDMNGMALENTTTGEKFAVVAMEFDQDHFFCIKTTPGKFRFYRIWDSADMQRVSINFLYDIPPGSISYAGSYSYNELVSFNPLIPKITGFKNRDNPDGATKRLLDSYVHARGKKISYPDSY